MKAKNPYLPFTSFCLRLPSLPFTFLDDLLNTKDISSSLKKSLKNTFIREAIFLASPALFSQLENWETDSIKNLKKKDRIQNSLLKYLTRMCSRSTPFGLFAGVAIGKFGNENAIEVLSSENDVKITRYDMHFLVVLAKHLEEKDAIRKQLKYYPNSTLYRQGERYRYIEYIYENKKRVHSIESVLQSDYLETILIKSEKGSTIADLTAFLIHEGFQQKESEYFINSLITNQILVSELEPTITGKDFLEVLKEKLNKLDYCKEEIEELNKLSTYLKDLSTPNSNYIDTSRTIKNYISTLKINLDPKFLIQTDLYPSFHKIQLEHRILKKVKLGIWVLNKISSNHKDPHLEEFKIAFNRRYEHRKMPLLNVLDIESGIGYGNNQVEATPFLDDIKLPTPKLEKKNELSPFQELLFEKLQICLTNKNYIVELTLKDLETFNENWENAPDTLSVMTEIVIQQGISKVVMNSASAHSLRLLGRFATIDNEVGVLTNEIALKEQEQNSDMVLAEIVHIPEARTGNILRRPHLREHEIPCLGHSNIPIEKQIRLKDLQVSVEYGEIILYDIKSGKQILPKLSNAHNYSNNSLPVYKFLCDLQHQNQQSYSFYWGGIIEKMAFLPRVVIKDIVLSKARWRVYGKNLEDLKSILKVNKNDKDNLSAMNEWALKLKLPKQIELVEGDNTLYINFTSMWSTSMFFEKVKNRDSIILQEILIDEDPIVKRDQESFKNEFIFSFYKDKKKIPY